jgi:hypothetical protein
MNRIRPRQKRSLGFEALEGRLTMSTGLAIASPHTHALAMSQAKEQIPASFKGHTSINGTTEVTPDLTGRIGRERLTGTGTATLSGTIIESGDAYLSNSQGSIQFSLGSASVTHVGKRTRQKVPVVVSEATGAFAQYIGTTGLLTTWNVPANPKATSTFSGYLTPP